MAERGPAGIRGPTGQWQHGGRPSGRCSGRHCQAASEAAQVTVLLRGMTHEEAAFGLLDGTLRRIAVPVRHLEGKGG